MRRDTGRLRNTEFEILVVGGGMHGAWFARRGAEAGYRVALIERDDFGAATSGNSLNILHGGLRYLQHLDLARMRDSIRARREFSRQSPHLVQALPCVMPLGTIGVRSPWILGPALLLNDLFSADRNSGVAGPAQLPAGRLMSARACRDHVAPLVDCDASAGALWWDALSLDSARLCLETVLAAERAGAVVANHVEALNYLRGERAIHGVTARDSANGMEFEIRAKVVVDTTGPGAGRLAVASRLPAPYLPESWIGAVNLVFNKRLALKAAVALSSASKSADGSALIRRATRDLFFVPWHGTVAVGTDYVSPVAREEVGIGPPDRAVEAFIDEIQRVAPQSGLRRANLAAIHWGILPGTGGEEPMPRKTPIIASGRGETGLDGLVVVIGEKLTSAPVLSQAVLARVESALGPRRARPTETISTEGVAAPAAGAELAIEIGDAASRRLELRYGTRWRRTIEPYLGQPALFEPALAGSEPLAVEIVHAVREEMALNLDDVLLRRLALALTGRPAAEMIRRCAQVAGREIGWSAEAQAAEIARLEATLDRSRPGLDPVKG